MFTRIILIIILTAAFNCVSSAQQDEMTGRECGTYQYNKMMMEKNPSFKNNFDKLEKITESYIAAKRGGTRDTVITIPVVVHVVWHTNAEKLLDQQVESQIQVLNEDYSGTNLDIINVPPLFVPVKAGDIGVRFCLATLDPNNEPTTGIVKKQTDITQFDFADNVKSSATGGDDAWPADKYLNVWTCNLSGSLLGYAQYPGGQDSTDGVVVLYKAFGRNGTAVKPYNKGRTLTHEIGHWLNLYHTWGDDGTACTGSDHVDDTPNQAGSTFHCPSYPQFSCNNAPQGDMFMNYMDYTDDSCMCLFTHDQRLRMLAALDNFRPNIKAGSQTDCSPLNGIADYSTLIIPNPNDGHFIVQFKTSIPDNFTMALFDLMGHKMFAYKVTGITSRNVRVQHSGLVKGVYVLRVDVEGHTYNNKIVIDR